MKREKVILVCMSVHGWNSASQGARMAFLHYMEQRSALSDTELRDAWIHFSIGWSMCAVFCATNGLRFEL